MLIHHIPIAITITVTIIIITMRSHSFAAELLQRVAVRSTSVAAITLYMLLALSCDHYSVVQCSASDRLNESLLASQHYNRILKFAKCQTPLAQVVNINSELHPSAIKKYIPHCTILHYCGPHSGCCRHENEQCVPKKVEEVKLYFWTIELTPRGHKKGIEVISMQNHTECMCAPINGKHSSNNSNISGQPTWRVLSSSSSPSSTTSTTTTTTITTTTSTTSSSADAMAEVPDFLETQSSAGTQLNSSSLEAGVHESTVHVSSSAAHNSSA